MIDLKLITAFNLTNNPENLEKYKEKTKGNICIVGVNTYNCMPIGALEGSSHIVVSEYTDGRVIDAPPEVQPRYNLVSKKIVDNSAKVWHSITIDEALKTTKKIKTEKQDVFIVLC